MTGYEKDKVYELRMKGVGYKAIAAVLGLSRDSVRNFCKTNALMGDALLHKYYTPENKRNRSFLNKG